MCVRVCVCVCARAHVMVLQNMLQSLGHAELNAGPVIECDVGFNVQVFVMVFSM